MRTKKEINAVYRVVHRDYKSTIDGVKYVLVLDENTGATILCPVNEMPEKDFQYYLNKSKK